MNRESCMPLFSWLFQTPKITNNTNTDNTKSSTDAALANARHKSTIDPSQNPASQSSMWPTASVRSPDIKPPPVYIATNKFAEQTMWPTAKVRTAHTIRTKQPTARKRH